MLRGARFYSNTLDLRHSTARSGHQSVTGMRCIKTTIGIHKSVTQCEQFSLKRLKFVVWLAWMDVCSFMFILCSTLQYDAIDSFVLCGLYNHQAY